MEPWQCPDSAQCREILVPQGRSLWSSLGFLRAILLIARGHRDRGSRPEKIRDGGWKQRLKAAHKCLLFSSGPLTSCLPAKRGPVRPAPRSNSLISRKNNNVRACFDLNKNKKRPKSCSLRLSLSPMRSVITPLFFMFN